MLVFCKSNDGKKLPISFFELGYTEKSEFNLLTGKEYEVFAISLWRGKILFLLADEQHLPNWFPVEIFTIVDPALPSNWSFFSDMTNLIGVQAIWGYEKIIFDESHYDDLMNRDPVAIKYFYEEEKIRTHKK